MPADLSKLIANIFGDYDTTVADITGRLDALEGATPTPTPTPTNITRITFDGDSITAGADSYANRYIANHPELTLTNRSRVSSTTGRPGDVDPEDNSLYARAPLVIADNPQVLFINIGANDLGRTDISATYDGSGPEETDWVTRYFAYVAYMRSQIPGLIVIGSGITPQTDEWSADSFRMADRRAVVNPILRAAVGNQLDGYAPLGDVWTDADAYDLDLMNTDGVHPQVEGRKLMERVLNAVLDPLVAGSTSNDPSAFILQDQNNVALSGTSTAATMITGMKLGHEVTASASNGRLSRNVDAFDTGTRQVMNGDIARIEATVPATNNAATEAVLAAGSQSDAFNARSIPATKVEFEHSTDARLVHDSMVDNDYIFNAVAFPAGRPILMVSESGSNEEGATINGVAATRIGGADTTVQHSIWIGPPSQTLTAGQQVEVRVNGGGFRTWCNIAPGAARNCPQEASAMAFRRIPLVAYTDRHVRVSPALTVGSGGLALFAYNGRPTSFDKFLGGTSIHAYPINSNSSSRALRWGTGRESGELGMDLNAATGSHSLQICALDVG